MLLRSWPRNRAGSSSMRTGLPQNGDQQLDRPSSLVGLPLQMLTTPQASGCVARRWSALATSSTSMKSRETARTPSLQHAAMRRQCGLSGAKRAETTDSRPSTQTCRNSPADQISNAAFNASELGR